jgi:hypothetical protein
MIALSKPYLNHVRGLIRCAVQVYFFLLHVDHHLNVSMLVHIALIYRISGHFRQFPVVLHVSLSFANPAPSARLSISNA